MQMEPTDSLKRLLEKHGFTVAELGERVARQLALQEHEELFVAGSLVEGLGNPTSDIDVYVVTPEPRRIACRSPSMSLGLGDLLVDLEVHGINELEVLTGRLEAWAAKPRVLADCFRIAERERLTLHRLALAMPVWGGGCVLQRLQEQVPLPYLARHKLDWAVAWISTLQTDMEGLRRTGDWQSLFLVSTELLGHTVDALLAAHFKTNPTPKWRITLLRTLPQEWERELPGRHTGQCALEVVMELLRGPATLSAETVHERAHAILALSRRILPWAEATLLGTGERLPGALAWTESGGRPMDRLGLAVQLGYRDQRFVIMDVSRRGYRFHVSPALVRLLCCLDGVSTEAGLRAALGAEGPSRVEELLALVRFGEFSAQPWVDTDRIEALLANEVEFA